MPRFSANLGMLWTEVPLPDGIRAAHAAGFDAVECQFPFDCDPETVRAALEDTGLTMLGLNTYPGDRSKGDFGLAAVPGREDEARAAIDQAIGYARAIGCPSIHVMSGIASGSQAGETLRANLAYALDQDPGILFLIEALNPFDAPGYFLGETEAVRAVVEDIDHPNLRLMFDCYHVARTEGDVAGRLNALYPLIGHIQFAGVPDRREPDSGQVNYRPIFEQIDAMGWTRPLGAEYRPSGPTGQSLGWMTDLRRP